MVTEIRIVRVSDRDVHKSEIVKVIEPAASNNTDEH